MSKQIQLGIVGYGNLGRGVEAAIGQNPDLHLHAIFSRRDPASVQPLGAKVAVRTMEELAQFEGEIDVLIFCGGSKDDLPQQVPEWASRFNTVDSFDTHARIPEYFETVDAAASQGGKVAVISVGWDPGLFSLARLLGESILPQGKTYSFWGKGLSQGHSAAVRRVPGVKGGVQYTLPSEQAMAQVRRGEQPKLSTRDKHARECWVVLEEGADAAEVEKAIVEMPNYFADYDTTVHFIDEKTLRNEHNAMPHGGFVIHSGTTGENTAQKMEFSLELGSNPEFTASVLVAYARAAHRLSERGEQGARTLFDIPPGLLSPHSAASLRARLL